MSSKSLDRIARDLQDIAQYYVEGVTEAILERCAVGNLDVLVVNKFATSSSERFHEVTVTIFGVF